MDLERQAAAHADSAWSTTRKIAEGPGVLVMFYTFAMLRESAAANVQSVDMPQASPADLSLEQLATIEGTSVSWKTERLDHAAWNALWQCQPAVYVQYRNAVRNAQELPSRQELLFYSSWQDALIPHPDLFQKINATFQASP